MIIINDKIGSPMSEVSNIVQLPAISKSGATELLSADLLRLDESTLKQMAYALGGELVYIKFRAIYTELETRLCNFKDCFRPADKNSDTKMWCDNHPNGRDTTKNVRRLGMTNEIMGA